MQRSKYKGQKRSIDPAEISKLKPMTQELEKSAGIDIAGIILKNWNEVQILLYSKQCKLSHFIVPLGDGMLVEKIHTFK